MIPEYIIGNDLKLKLAFVINGQRVNPDTVPFDIKVWTLYPSQARIASYDGENWVNCLMRDDYLEVNLNAPQFNAGRLNCDITLHYPDADMPDLVRDKICKVRFDNPLINPTTNDVVITGEISDAIVGLSAYNIAIQNGFVGSVIEWLQSLKQPAIDAATIAENMMGDFSEDETLRSTAEQGRVTAETSRTNAETSRGTAEQGRVTAEITRVNSETARGTAETARTNAETSRGAAEQGRVTAETARTNAETSRGAAEQGRVTAETSRTNAETSRDTAEQGRVNAETTRVNSETARGTAEQGRVTAETARQQNEASRIATINGLEGSLALKIDKTSIVQDFGNDEAKVLSQKAITDLLKVDRFTSRVIADGGKIHSKKLLEETYLAYKDLLPNANILLMPELGVKTRISGINEFISKLYDLSANNNDAVQSTEANQPFLGNIPVGKYNLFGTSKTLAFTSNAFINTAQWSAVLVFTQLEVTNLLIGGTTTKIQVNGLTQNTLTFINESGTSVSMNISNTIGRRNVLILNALGDGNLQVWLNGLSQGSVVNPTNVNLTTLYGSIHSRTWLASIFNKALSSIEIQNLNSFLTSTFEDIPSAKIGYQSWELHNFDSVNDGVGNVINEVQGATTEGNMELITNGGFNTDSGWNIGVGWYLSGGVATYTGGDGYLRQAVSIIKGTCIKFTVNLLSGSIFIYFGDGSAPVTITTIGEHTIYNKWNGVNQLFSIYSGGTASIDNVSIKEVGWADSPNVYNYIYASTPGIAGHKESTALKAAAMWCYYDNNINNCAIYGKLYNWYAVKLISRNPPIGWRVPTSADFAQLSSYLGGDAVAGGKMRYNGLTYWSGSNATNGSGFSGFGNGVRSTIFNMVNNKVHGAYAILDTTYNHRLLIASDSNLRGINYSYDLSPATGISLRLLKTSPIGEVNTPITSGYFTTDIAAGIANKDVMIPFGFEVTSIIIKSDASLTNVVANLYSTDGVIQATLLTGKSVTANIPNVFSCLVDQVVQYTNPFVRINATSNVGMEVIINLQKILL